MEITQKKPAKKKEEQMEATKELIEKLSKLEIFSDLDINNAEHERLLESVCKILEP